jgi:hypothetical protein
MHIGHQSEGGISMFTKDLSDWKRFLSALKPGQIFSARLVMPLASPSVIYKRLSRLVQAGVLRRLSYGLYMKVDRKNPDQLPPLETIAHHKNKAFARSVVTDEDDQAAIITGTALSEIELIIHSGGYNAQLLPVPASESESQESSKNLEKHQQDNEQNRRIAQVARENGILAVDSTITLKLNTSANSTSFKTVAGKVVLKKVNARKMTLGDSPIGKVLRGWWALGKDKLDDYELIQGYKLLERSGRRDLRRYSCLVPNWLNEIIKLGANDYLWEFARAG